MTYKIGDSIKVITNMFEGIGVYKGATILVVQECETEGQWLDRRGVEAEALNTFANGKYFELVEEEKMKTKFAVGDKVISIKDTDQTVEGTIGYVTENNNTVLQGRYPYTVKCEPYGALAAFKEDELELLSIGVRLKESKPDVINSPKHYAVFEQVEAIQVIASSMTQDQFYGYCLGNILKYRLRAGGKDDVIQELGKADKYQELYTQHKHLCKEGK